MHVQATSQPSSIGTTVLDNKVCSRCGGRLSRNNLDDVCRPCSGLVITTDAPRPAESRQSEITGTAINKRIYNETRNEVTSGSRTGICPAGPIAGQLIKQDACEDCAGAGWDSSDVQIWCPTCCGTGKAEEAFIVASQPSGETSADRAALKVINQRLAWIDRELASLDRRVTKLERSARPVASQ
jgi:hypothetical protein